MVNLEFLRAMENHLRYGRLGHAHNPLNRNAPQAVRLFE
jgi:hypothetical protein